MAEKTQKRGLGTGLGALFGDTPVGNELDGAFNVRIEKVEPRAEQPRKSFGDESLEQLADSISQFGVIQPITVRKQPGGYYQIIAGERRWRAARIAGLEEVPIRVIEADDLRAMELALVENLQREDLNPIEEAKGYKTLMSEYGMTQEQTSQSVGRSRPAVANALRLLSLCPQVLELLETGKLSAGHARPLLAISDHALQAETALKVIEEGLSARQAEKLAAKIAENASGELAEPQEKQPETVNYVAEIERRLESALGRKVHIKSNRKQGKIELAYYGEDDRETLINTLLSLGTEEKESAI